MPDPDLQQQEADPLSFDDIPFPEDAVVEESPAESEEPAAETEESEPSAEAEGSAEQAPPADNDEPDLADFPEELREKVRAYKERNIGRIQKSWQEKIDEAAEIRKDLERYKGIVDGFDQRLKTDPHGLLKDLQAQITEVADPRNAPPQPPGEMPDFDVDPEAFRKWFAQNEAYRNHQMQTLIDEREQKIKQTLDPIVKNYETAQQQAAMRAAQQTLGAQDDEWNETLALLPELGKDKMKALASLLELVRARKGRTQQAAKTAEAIRGSEPRPGLPRTGARAKPKPTGDVKADLIAELEFDGLIPDEF